MFTFKGYLAEMYSFIPQSSDDIRKSTLPNKDKVAKLFDLIQAQTKSAIKDPLAIDFTKPNNIKIHRGLQGELELKPLESDLGVKLSFGNGSRGNAGAGNRGLAFERFLSKDLGVYLQTRSDKGDYKYPKFMKMFINKYLKDKKDIEIIDEGALNKPRPLKFQGNQVLVGGPLGDVGATVTDITLKTDKGPMYLSLKMGGTVTFFNSGVTKFLTKKDIEDGTIRQKEGKAILDTLGIDPQMFVDVFQKYDPKARKAPKKEINVTSKVNKQRLINFLASGVGYGYYLVHAASPTKDSITEFYIDKKDVMNYVQPQKVIVQYPTGGSAKRIDVLIETPKFTFKVNIRNKQGGTYPSHIMCDYKIKGH